MNAWTKLDKTETNNIWKKFEKKFHFSPNKQDKRFKEQSPSATYDISDIYHAEDGFCYELHKDLERKFRKVY